MPSRVSSTGRLLVSWRALTRVCFIAASVRLWSTGVGRKPVSGIPSSKKPASRSAAAPPKRIGRAGCVRPIHTLSGTATSPPRLPACAPRRKACSALSGPTSSAIQACVAPLVKV